MKNTPGVLSQRGYRGRRPKPMPAFLNERECAAAALDTGRVVSIARRLSKAAKEAEAMGLIVFGGSGSGTLRFDDGGQGRLIVASLQGNFDGGDGADHLDENGLERGE